MLKSLVPLLLISLLTATSAQAQYGGGGGMGGGGGHGHKGGKGGGSPSPAGKPADAPPTPPEKPVNQIEIVGVIKAVDPKTERITISYEAVEALNWPAGTMPFVVGKSALLNGATVGEKVRFKLDSQQISELKPY